MTDLVNCTLIAEVRSLGEGLEESYYLWFVFRDEQIFAMGREMFLSQESCVSDLWKFLLALSVIYETSVEDVIILKEKL